MKTLAAAFAQTCHIHGRHSTASAACKGPVTTTASIATNLNSTRGYIESYDPGSEA